MGGLNLTALKDAQTDLQKRTQGGGFLQQKDLTEETDVRILPPLARLNGLYYVEQKGYWINKKFYIVGTTFDPEAPDVIKEEIELATADAAKHNDKELSKLLNDREKLRFQSQFLVPLLLLKDAGGTLIVEGDKAKVLNCGMTIIKGINTIATSKAYQNGTDDGIFDRVKGRNMILSRVKTGSKNTDVEYKVTPYGDASEMPEKYYEKIPDVMGIARKAAFTDEYLRQVIINYLYGEQITLKEEECKRYPDEKGGDEGEAKEGGGSEAGRRRRGGATAETTATAAEPKKEEKKEEKPAETGGRRRRNAAADLGNVDD